MLTDLAPPPAAAAQIAALAAQLRLPGGYADEPEGAARLAALLEAAVAHIERRIERAFRRRLFRLDMGHWPPDGRVTLPIGPLVRLVSLDLVDAKGGRAPWPVDRVLLDALGLRPVAQMALPDQWPPIPVGGYAELVFEAGYGFDWADVPPDLRLAVLMMAAALHDTGLDSQTMALPFGVVALTEPYRRLRV